ncbi:MAG TPA: hypothetical protein VF323_12120 [Candidatus Limnocylindrales bacterium]
MNHADVRDRLELAALEPDGLDRLMAGDTPDAIAIAGHLAGCPACLDELGRLRRTATLVRLALEGAPEVVPSRVAGADAGEPALPADLRERTLAFVRELGVRRPVISLAEAAAMVDTPRGATMAPPMAQPAHVGAAPPARTAPRRGLAFLRPAAWPASLAAAIVISVVATSILLGTGHSAEDTADLTRLAAWSIDVARAPDARQVSLKSPTGAATVGLLAFAPSDGDLVVSAHDLSPAPAGKEYRCWMATANGRRVVGKMFFAGGIAYWVGPVTGLGSVPSGTSFGVTLVDLSGPSIDGDPVLLGTL